MDTWIRSLERSLAHSLTLEAPPPKGEPTSAVLALIGLGEKRDLESAELVLTRRTETVLTHKGQVSFPGGRQSPSDRTLSDTALRETHEEIGVSPKDVSLHGSLSPLQTRFDIWIYPYVGSVTLPYRFVPNVDEVARLFLLPLSHLLANELSPRRIPIHAGVSVASPALEWDGELIWGATAKLLVDLRRHLLSAIGPNQESQGRPRRIKRL